MADYPLKIPIFPVCGSNNYPRSLDRNSPNREIEAICTELGTNPRVIDDSVAPTSSPADVAEYLDMLANIVKTMSGADHWYEAAVPTRRFIAGNGGGGTVAAGEYGIVGLNRWNLDTLANEELNTAIITVPCQLTSLSAYIGTQPGTGSLVFLVRRLLVATALELTIDAGGSGYNVVTASGSPETGRLIVRPGDRMSVRVLNNASSASAEIYGVVLGFRQITRKAIST